MPFYLHPRNPLPRRTQIYEGHAWLLGPTWAFGQETAVHALRLMGSGSVRSPSGLAHHHWPYGRRPALQHVAHRPPQRLGKTPPRYKAKKKICEYFHEHFYLTTSGNFRTQTLIDAMLEVGADRDPVFRPTGRSRTSITPRNGSTAPASARTIAGRSDAITRESCYKLDDNLSQVTSKVAQAAE